MLEVFCSFCFVFHVVYDLLVVVVCGWLVCGGVLYRTAGVVLFLSMVLVSAICSLVSIFLVFVFMLGVSYIV